MVKNKHNLASTTARDHCIRNAYGGISVARLTCIIFKHIGSKKSALNKLGSISLKELQKD